MKYLTSDNYDSVVMDGIKWDVLLKEGKIEREATNFIYGIPDKCLRQGYMKKILDTDKIKKENETNTYELDYSNGCSCGVRIRFMLKAERIILKCHLERIWAFTKMQLFNSSGFDIYQKGYIHKTVIAPEQGQGFFMEEIMIQPMETVEIYLPNYNRIIDLAIGHADESNIETAPEYAHAKPIVFYGNSITQGAAASRSGNSFPNIISRKLNSDILNFSFSGACLGEGSMAESICKSDMSAMVIDYTRNAKSFTEFSKRINKFYCIIRSHFPDIPIILLDGFNTPTVFNEYIESLCHTEWKKDNTFLVRQSCLFTEEEKLYSSVDGVHYTDMGMFKIADEIIKILDGKI